MHRVLKLIHRKEFIATYTMTLLVLLGISFLVYTGISRAMERKPVTVSLLARMSDMKNGSIVLFDVTVPGAFFGSDSPFEETNVIRLESPDIYLFEPNDPASLDIDAPMTVDEDLENIPQYTLRPGEDSIVHVTANNKVRIDFAATKGMHVLMGYPSDFSRTMGLDKQLLAFDFRSLDNPPKYTATMTAVRGTDAVFTRSRTRPTAPDDGSYTFHGHFDPAGKPSPFYLSAPAPEAGVGMVGAADLVAGNSNLSILVPVSTFFTIRDEASLVLGQQRYKIETTDRLSVRNLVNGTVHIRTDGDLIELRGTGKDISLNGTPLVQREFERMSAPLQGAIAGLLTTIAFSIGRVVITLASRTLQRTSRTE